VKEETQTIDYNFIDKIKSTATGEHAIMPLITRELEAYNEAEWNIINMPTFTEIKIAFEPEIKLF